LGLDNEKFFAQLTTYAADLLNCQPICQFYYHNLDHTKSVVNNVEIIGKEEGVDEETMFVLKASAWFHDLGYTNSYIRHEDESIKLAKNFLEKRKIFPSVINKVIDLINATRISYIPETLSDKIISDADLFDLGTNNYFKQSENLWKEWNKNLKMFNELEFWQISYDFVNEHNYLTNYAKRVLEPKKQENLLKLEKMLANMK